MTSPIDSSLQLQIDRYLDRLRQALGGLPAEEIEEIVREIASHIAERAAAVDPLNAAGLERILGALGNPEALASLYQSRVMAARARTSTSPRLIFTTTLRWAGMSLAGVVSFLVGLFGYVLGLGFLITPVLKLFHPDRVGLWVGPHMWDLSMGSLSAADLARYPAHEVMGWWLLPLGLILGPLVLIVTTLVLRWALRFAFSSKAVLTH